jgi:L-lactate dehydrogenase (cytochrome)
MVLHQNWLMQIQTSVPQAARGQHGPSRSGSATAPNARLGRFLSLEDFESAARRHLPRPVFAYVSGGVERNESLHANRAAFAQYAFVPRVMVDIRTGSTAVTLLGKRYAAPFGIAPMGLSALSAYRGDVVQARSAAAENIPMVMSGASLMRMEDVLDANPDAWFQAYLPPGEAAIGALIDRVKAAGFRTLVITADTPVSGNREHNVRAGFSTPLRPSVGLAWQGLQHPRWLFGTFLRTLVRHGLPHFESAYAHRGAPILSQRAVREMGDRGHLNWDCFRMVRRMWSGPVVVKGILDARDARRAVDLGADGIIVSNHGGRQLDGAAAPLCVLPQVVAACPDVPVMIDSGIRRGTDVLKALALGARMVFVGRPFNYAASVAGEAGVRHGISLLQQEISRNMAMLGINSLSELDASFLLARSTMRT